jgi:histidinol dehydrogenase
MTAPAELASIRFRGTIAGLDPADRAALLDRARGAAPAVERAVAEVIEQVRRDGVSAVRTLTLAFDGVRLGALEVPRDRLEQAFVALEPALRSALERARRNITRAHEAFMPRSVEVEIEPGVIVGRRVDPLARVGIYAPGGRAAYASSVLMGAVPARVAGVREVILCSPPDSSGQPPALVLAAAHVAKVDRVFAIGGATAIAALALGTDSVPRVALIAGPGGAFVTEAKRQLTDVVATDGTAGPSEILVIADHTADADQVAAELVAQAEHDPEAVAVALCVGSGVLDRMRIALEWRLERTPRRVVVRAALARNGALLAAASLDEALIFAEAFAPEHLFLVTANAEQVASRVRAAGALFIGAQSSVVFGDYITGANHVLPTQGAARAASGLSTDRFVRWTSYQRVTAEAASRLAADTALLARAEGLPAHADAALWEVQQ